MESTLSGAAVKIRRLEVQDIDAVVGIQTQCPEASQWSRKEYELLAAAGVREQHNTVLGSRKRRRGRRVSGGSQTRRTNWRF